MTWHDFIRCEIYTWRHKGAFLRIERKLLGHNTLRGLVHDGDKVFYLYPIAFLSGRDIKWVKTKHRHHNAHHAECNRKKTRNDYIEMIIDWECARYTKPDKPLNAYQTMKQIYPELEPIILPLLKELKLA